MENKAEAREEVQPSGMEVKTRLRAGALTGNENETLLNLPPGGAEQKAEEPSGMEVKTRLRAGGLSPYGNENETLLSLPPGGAEPKAEEPPDSSPDQK